MNFNQQDLIDSYLRGELSGKDHATFEQQMDADPSFKEEVQFEQFVKNGISQYRKAELKGRLNAIDITPDVVGFGLGGNALIKTMGGTLAAVVIGVVTYYGLSDSWSSDEPVNFTYIDGKYYPEPLDVPAITVPEFVEAESDQVNSYNTLTVSKADVGIAKMKTPIKDELVAEVNELTEFVPTVTPPDLNDVASEEAINTESGSIPDVSVVDRVGSNTTPLDVQTINKKYETIRYRYIDGKIYLYGDFGKQPYEIIEINKADERRIYVYFDFEYYTVNITDQVEELPLIRNEKLIEELEILRNNKVAE